MTAGIYKIESADGKVYIGSAVYIERRWSQHKHELRSDKHHSPHLQNAWNKYGADYFTFNIIEIVEDISKLLYYEQIWLDIVFQSLERDEIYNVAITAGSSLGIKRSDAYKQKISAARKGKTLSDEAKAKLSAAKKGKTHSDEAKSKMSAAKKGKKHSDETKAKMSAAKKGKTLSDETKAKMSAAHARTFTMMSPEGILTTFTNMNAFCREHGLNKGVLHETYSCRRKKHKGWTNPACNKGKDINE